jgi:hypothetical protein
MRCARQGLAAMAGIAVLAALAALGGRAVALTSEDEPTAGGDDTEAADGGRDDADTDAPSVAAPPPLPSVSLSGGLTCCVPLIAEATTRWRYGRARRDASIDETTSRVRVSGSGSGCNGLKVDFSVELFVPALRVGSYTLGPTSPAPVRPPGALWGELWARRDRSSATPDVEWDTRGAGGSQRWAAAGAGAAERRASRDPEEVHPSPTLTLLITSMTEMAHASERVPDGTVTLDTTRFRIHGSIRGVLPCTRGRPPSGPSACRAETLVGSF